MFNELVPLSAETHQVLRFTEQQSYEFARELMMIPVTAAELYQVAREMPIVFPADNATPQALSGVSPGNNVHVDDKGGWTGRYVPAHLRRYPFALQALPEEQQKGSGNNRSYGIFFDQNAPHFAGDSGQALFDQDGQPSEVLQKVQQVLVAIEQDVARSRALVGQLEEHGLLRSHTLRVGPPKVDPVALEGFRVLDRQAFRKLSGEALSTLQRSGALAMIYAHSVSLSNLQDGWLARQVAASMPGFDEDTLPLSLDEIDWSKF